MPGCIINVESCMHTRYILHFFVAAVAVAAAVAAVDDDVVALAGVLV